MAKNLEPEDKVIERFENIFENKDEKLKDTIIIDENMKNLYLISKDRGLNSLKLAKNIFLLSSVSKDFKKLNKETLGLVKDYKLKVLKDSEARFYDWVIEIAYYAMYDLATSAIAKEGFKCTTHYTTRLTLEYIYCVKGKDREKLFKIYDKVLLKRENIKKIKKAQEKREISRYQVTEKIEKDEAEEILNYAEEFAKEILPIILE